MTKYINTVQKIDYKDCEGKRAEWAEWELEQGSWKEHRNLDRQQGCPRSFSAICLRTDFNAWNKWMIKRWSPGTKLKPEEGRLYTQLLERAVWEGVTMVMDQW